MANALSWCGRGDKWRLKSSTQKPTAVVKKGSAMPGNMTKSDGLDWLARYGAVTRGYPQEAAAAYLGLGVQRFREEVAAGRLPPPQRYGKRLVWDKSALDQHKDRWLDGSATDNAGSSQTNDPIMASINAAKVTAVRSGRPS
jgi:hypothetical protein